MSSLGLLGLPAGLALQVWTSETQTGAAKPEEETRLTHSAGCSGVETRQYVMSHEFCPKLGRSVPISDQALQGLTKLTMGLMQHAYYRKLAK